MGRSYIQYKKNYLSEWNLPTIIQGIATGGLCNHHCNPVLFLILSVTMYITNENGSRSSPTWSLWPRTILWEPPSCRSVPLIRIWDPTVRSPTISWPVTWRYKHCHLPCWLVHTVACYSCNATWIRISYRPLTWRCRPIARACLCSAPTWACACWWVTTTTTHRAWGCRVWGGHQSWIVSGCAGCFQHAPWITDASCQHLLVATCDSGQAPLCTWSSLTALSDLMDLPAKLLLKSKWISLYHCLSFRFFFIFPSCTVCEVSRSQKMALTWILHPWVSDPL